MKIYDYIFWSVLLNGSETNYYQLNWISRGQLENQENKIIKYG